LKTKTSRGSCGDAASLLRSTSRKECTVAAATARRGTTRRWGRRRRRSRAWRPQACGYVAKVKLVAA
jgi:hypothetical protein